MGSYLVTGANGFIGGHLLNSLKESNSIIKLLLRSSESILPSFHDYDLYFADIGKQQLPDNLMTNVDTVFHLAGISADIHGTEKNADYQAVNVKGTIELAQKAINAGVTKFVFISSVKAAGDPPDSDKCITEEDYYDPSSPYAISKRDAEIALLELSKASGMSVVIIRPALVYGDGVRGNLKMMAKGIKSGWFLPVPENHNKRSMIHITDLIMAIRFLESEERANNQIFNITDGQNYSTRQIYNSMCLGLNKKVPGWSLPEVLFRVISIMSKGAKHKVNKLLGSECYSSEKLRSLGFVPQFSIDNDKNWMV